MTNYHHFYFGKIKLVIICLLIGAVFGQQLALENGLNSQLEVESKVVQIEKNNTGSKQFNGISFGGKLLSYYSFLTNVNTINRSKRC